MSLGWGGGWGVPFNLTKKAVGFLSVFVFFSLQLILQKSNG